MTVSGGDGTGPDLEISRAWLVDPASGREGPGEIVVEDGILEAVTWIEGDDALDVTADGIVIAPGFVDLHAHLREPGNEDAETVATGLAAAAHGGFTTICAMPNTTPALDEPGVLAGIRAAAAASGSAVELLAIGAVTAGREGDRLSALGELADVGVIGFSDDGAPVRSAGILRSALAYAGALGLPVIDHPEDATQTEGAEANEGFVATVLGLRGWPVAAEAAAVARDLAILADVVRDVPGARLHLTHVSTAAALDLIRAAKTAGLPVTCDVAVHHLHLCDIDIGWFDAQCRLIPPLRSTRDRAALRAGLGDGTIDLVCSDHAPVDDDAKQLPFGEAEPGATGLELLQAGGAP